MALIKQQTQHFSVKYKTLQEICFNKHKWSLIVWIFLCINMQMQQEVDGFIFFTFVSFVFVSLKQFLPLIGSGNHWKKESLVATETGSYQSFFFFFVFYGAEVWRGAAAVTRMGRLELEGVGNSWGKGIFKQWSYIRSDRVLTVSLLVRSDWDLMLQKEKKTLLGPKMTEVFDFFNFLSFWWQITKNIWG